jgi:hypothetical protein
MEKQRAPTPAIYETGPAADVMAQQKQPLATVRFGAADV